jgi:hypothetical protein
MNLEEILDTIMYKEAKPTHEALERWVALYPQHKADLVEFFATWAEQATVPDETAIDEEKISSRLVSHALNLAYHQTAAEPAAVVDTEVTRLSKAIAQRGISEAEFASHCNLDARLVAKLDRRLIRPGSIPALLVRLVSEVLRLRDAVVQRLFAAEPIPLHSYKAKKQPELKTEEFLDAVQGSGLSPDAKAEWIRTVESERKGTK